MIAELERRVKKLETTVNQMIRLGIVTSVQEKKGTVRVKLPDADNLITKELSVLFTRTSENKSYDMPDIDEQVVCLFLPNGMEQGFVIGSVYSKSDPVPVSNSNKKHYVFKDGTWMEYDRKAHKMTINVKGRLDIHADKEITIDSGEHIKFTAPRIDHN